jgi:hypothetical protein
MQFNMRLDAPHNEPHERVERDFDETVKLAVVHLVKRHVHETGEIALNEQLRIGVVKEGFGLANSDFWYSASSIAGSGWNVPDTFVVILRLTMGET